MLVVQEAKFVCAESIHEFVHTHNMAEMLEHEPILTKRGSHLPRPKDAHYR